MSQLFKKTKISNMALANRFERSATWEGMADEDGSVTPKLIKIMTDLAKGGVGMIITSHAYVQPEGQASPWQLGIYKDELVPGLREMTGDLKIFKNLFLILLMLLKGLKMPILMV